LTSLLNARLQTFEHDSPIGHWTVTTCVPDPRLEGLVATLWFGSGHVSYQRDRILPSGQSQLLINLGPPQYRIEPGPPERRVPFVDIWYAALHQGPIDTETPHGNALLGVAFSACGAFPWLQAEVGALTDRVIPLTDAVGDGALALRERLLNTTSIAERFTLVERWLLRRLSTRHVVHPAVRWSVDRIARSGGRLPIGRLARESGYTRKHLAGLFVTQVGLTPKALSRVQRFRRALRLLGAPDRMPWAALADQCGYYDQSHLTSEFRLFAGVTPAELARHVRPDPQSVVLR
jgi:AraC-like DNA-binding protein